MSGEERKELLAWYERHKYEPFYNRHVLEAYCQDDVTFQRQACRVFRREFVQIGNIEVFLESLTISSAFNKLLPKFLKHDIIVLIRTAG